MQKTSVHATHASRPVIIWGNRKIVHQRDKGVRQACAHPRLLGRKLLARGAFSLVFEQGDSVLKLTADPITYDIADLQARWQSPGLPATRGLHGQVGFTDFGAPLYLLEQERLKRLEPGSDARRLSLQVGRMVRESGSGACSAADTLRELLPAVADANLANALGCLETIARRHPETAALDLHASNFMQRAAAAVITDALLDRGVLHLAQQHCLREAGLPLHTVFL